MTQITQQESPGLSLRVRSASLPGEVRHRPFRSILWYRFRRNKAALASLGFLGILLVGTIVGPMLSPYSYEEMNPLHIFDPPSAANPLGTDELGRDVLTRLAYGGRFSLTVGVVAVVIGVSIGTAVGAASGFFGGFADAVLMRVTDAFMALPQLFLLLTVLAVFSGSVTTMMVAIGATSWMSVARLVRGEYLRWKRADFVEAARVLGASNLRIIMAHLLPQALSSIIVAATLYVAGAILAESSLSFLGLGVQPPTPTWGNMLTGAQNYVWNSANLAVYPGLLILFTVLAFNFLGDGLRDALDPRMKQL